MGLDMYLRAERYIWRHQEEEAAKAKAIAEILELPMGSIQEISAEVAYWRKSNQIHAWFVDNVQGENDDCGDYEVSYEQLTELRDTVRKVLVDHSLAEELLPTKEGFFFGSTGYTDDYFQDLNDTDKQLTEVLDKFATVEGAHSWYFKYHSSW